MPLWMEVHAKDIASVPPVDHPTTMTFSPLMVRPGYLRSSVGKVLRAQSSAEHTSVMGPLMMSTSGQSL